MVEELFGTEGGREPSGTQSRRPVGFGTRTTTATGTDIGTATATGTDTGTGTGHAAVPGPPHALLRQATEHHAQRVPMPPTIGYAVTALCGLTVLGAVLVSAALLTGPVCLGLTGATLIVVMRIGAGMFVRFALIQRSCELAGSVTDRRLPTADAGVTASSPAGRLRSSHLSEPRVSEGSPKTFWQALDRKEKDALLALGELQTFPGGSEIFHEREAADQVLIIFSGWTKICVHEGCEDRTVALRGPGQIIGERAALQVNVRSASVLALDDVEALVLGTDDFAGFIGAYPHVLSTVEDQIYDRLCEPEGGVPRRRAPEPARGGPGDRDARRSADRPCFQGEHCTVLLTDVAGFAAGSRNDEDRQVIRATQFNAVRSAFTESGLGDLEQCHWEDRGDGLLIVIPPAIPARIVLASIVPRLTVTLQRHNRRSTKPVQIKLRLAIHVGPVTSDSVGVSGEAIIHAARILEAETFKRGLARSSAHLGVIASSFVFQGIIRHSPETLHAHEYAAVRGQVKESKVTGWMRLTGISAPPDPPRPRRPKAE